MKAKVGLIGMPIAHSLSPLIHQGFHSIPYHLYETLDIERIIKDKHIVGLNVTSPLKERAFQLATHKDIYSSKTGAVNTLIRRSDDLYGYNTDVMALIDLFNEHLKVSKDTPILIMGNGATEKSVRLALEETGFKRLHTLARNPKPNQSSWHDQLNHPHVFIQTTPLGMDHIDDEFPFDAFDFSQTQFIFDVVYAPLNSPLIQKAKTLKIPHLNGLSMLIRQAFYAAKLFTNQDLQHQKISVIEKKILKEKENIILIGMPYSGKTTLGKALSIALKKPFIDTDVLIENEINMSIKDYLALHGENLFREVERKAIKTLKSMTGSVISTGGGAILDSSNVEILKLNGCFLYLDSPTPKTFDDTRPLSSNLKMYLTLKKERHPLYKSLSDINLIGYQDTQNYIKEFKNKYETYLNTKWSQSKFTGAKR
jgi:shikimate dehydrogenase